MQMSNNMIVRTSVVAVEILSESPQAKVRWPSSEVAVKCKDAT